MDFVIGKEKLATAPMAAKQHVVLRLLDHILQPTVFEDIRTVADTWRLEVNQKNFEKSELVEEFLKVYQAGMLPRGEMFVDSNTSHVEQAVKAFHLLYFAKEFDAFINVACWLRERVNPGLFVYALTTAVFHRSDCRGIILPAPYEVYPYLFVNSSVINQAFMMKMTKGDGERAIMDYWGIKVEKNVCYIDSRTTLRYTFSLDDVLNYFTEDFDLNTYMYNLHMSFPYWMSGNSYKVQEERRGESMLYGFQQLLARLRLERLSHGMCGIVPIKWDENLKTGYWPKIRLHTGDEMPCRSNDTSLVHEYNYKIKDSLEDYESRVRSAVSKGRLIRNLQIDDRPLKFNKLEDIEMLGRWLTGGLAASHDDPTVMHSTNLMQKMLAYATYNIEKNTYVPTATDMYSTFLRDPASWRVLKRVMTTSQLFKNQLPRYTREELNFPGVKVVDVSTTELVTFMDYYNMDITNAVYLSESEVKNKRSDMMFVARQRCLNNQPFKITMTVVSEKALNAVVRVFLGPKYDCLGRLTDVNDKQIDMVELDSCLYKLNAGRNLIVRESVQMQGVIEDRPWSRRMWDHSTADLGDDRRDRVLDENWWYKSRVGFPHRLLLPMGSSRGLELQFFVIVSPVHSAGEKNVTQPARWSTGIDNLPLGFPFDRVIDPKQFLTDNMRFADVMVYRKDVDVVNEELSKMSMRRDDLSVLDKDLLSQ